MAKEKMCGVYCIENLVDGKKYIGQSSDIQKRWYEHKRRLNKNEHYNLYLQRAWNKYGQDNFKFYILKLCKENQLDDLEVYYIDLFNANCSDYGYNETSGGEGVRGYHLSDDQRRHISEIKKGKKIPDDTRKKISEALTKRITDGYMPKVDHLIEYNKTQMKQIDCYNIFGDFICIYDSIHDAARKLGVEATNISKVLLEKHSNCNGMVFYYHNGNIVPKTDIILRACRNPIFLIDGNNEPIELFSDSKDVERKLKVDASSVIKICNGKGKSIHGYSFIYATKELLDKKYGCVN